MINEFVGYWAGVAGIVLGFMTPIKAKHCKKQRISKGDAGCNHLIPEPRLHIGDGSLIGGSSLKSYKKECLPGEGSNKIEG